MKKFNIKSLVCFMSVFLFIVFVNFSQAFAEEALNSYKINGILDDTKKILTANEVVSFNNNYGESLKEIVFHLYPDSYNSSETIPSIGDGKPPKLSEEEIGDIQINSVLVNNEKVTFSQENQILKINLNKILKPNENLQITLDFTLKLPHNTQRLGYFEDVYSFTNWYPILSIYNSTNNTWDENPFYPIGESNYSESSNYDITLEMPKTMLVASTGVDKKVTLKGDKKIINISAEKVRDFVFIASSKFKRVSQKVDGVRVNSFYFDNGDAIQSKGQAMAVLSYCSDAISFFSKEFGQYPFEEFDIVETYLTGGAMEYPQLIQMGVYGFDPDENYSGINSYMPFEIAGAVHEVGHQWWFSVVGNNEFKESFLDESLTTYSTAYYFEKKYGKYSNQGTFTQFRLHLYPDENQSTPINSSVDEFTSWSDYSTIIYRKGALVFEDLRQRAGEEKFLQILKTYFEKYKFKNASIEGFLSVIEEISGEDTEKSIREALNSKSYFPENLMIPDDEKQVFYREMEKQRLLEQVKKYGLSLDSLAAKGLTGEKIYLIKPSNLSGSDKSQLDQLISSFKDSYKMQYNIDLIIKDDKDFSEEEMKNNNIILLGSPWNNSIINALNSELPITLTKYSLAMSDLAIYNNNIQGQFAAENPYNKDKTLLVLFWTKELNMKGFYNYGTYYDEAPPQFVININNKKQISGRY